MSVTVKAFLYRHSWREEPVEIRRFSLDQDVSSNYAYLVQKVVQVFPSLPANDVIVAWTGKLFVSEDADAQYYTIYVLNLCTMILCIQMPKEIRLLFPAMKSS